MAVTRNRIAANLERVQENVAAACGRAGRLPEDVSIVAVTKAAGLDALKGLIDVGLTDLGESRAQQLTRRAAEVDAYLRRRRSEPGPGDVRWHMIGHLQRNKVRPVLQVAHVIHSVDSLRLAEELNKRAEDAGRVVDVFVQVNCSQERQKFGVAVGAAIHFAEMMCTLRNLRLMGLMTMAPLVSDPEQARPTFVRLRELFEEIRKQKTGGEECRHLSMGMSQDYVVAVEEGATVLRIGTALLQ